MITEDVIPLQIYFVDYVWFAKDYFEFNKFIFNI